LANTVAASLKKYIEVQQASARPPIQPDDRVRLPVLVRGGHTVLSSPRSKTLPVVIFITLLGGLIFLIFALENIRPSVRTVGEEWDGDQHGASAVLLPEIPGRSMSR